MTASLSECQFHPLLSYATAISQSLEMEVILNNALDLIVDQCGLDAGLVYLFEPTGELRQVVNRVKPSVAVHAIDLDELAAGAFGAHEPGTASLPDNHPSGLRAIASFPLIKENEKVGVLILGSLDRLFESDMELLSGMASLLASTVVNAQQYRQAIHLRDRLAALHTTLTHVQRAGTLCDKLEMIANALHNMGWRHVTLWLCDDNLSVTDVVYAGITRQTEAVLRRSEPPGVEFYRRPPDELRPFQLGSSYLVTRTGAKVVGSVYVPMAWRSGDAVYVPLNDPYRKRIVGSIELRDPTDGLRPTRDDLNIMELFAREAVHEIEQARQGDMLGQQARDLAMLYEAGAAIFSHREEGAILALLNRILCDAAESVGVSFAEYDVDRGIARRVACYHAPSATPEERAKLRPNSTYSLSSDLIEGVIKKHQPYVTSLDECLVLYLPVALGEQVLGLVEICDANAKRTFAEGQVALVRAIANQSAIALSHARLYRNTAVERSRLRAILEASRDGIVLISHDTVVLDLNGAACRLLRLMGEPEDWLGDSVIDLAFGMRHYAPGATSAALCEIRRIREGQQVPGRGEFEVMGTSPAFIMYTIYPIHTVAPRLTGWLLLLHDATEERELARARDDLTHMLVHDLRSPLTAIISAINMLSYGMVGEVPDEQMGMLNIVRTNGERMMAMINAILDIARLETGQVPLKREPLSPVELVSEVINTLVPSAEERQIELVFDPAPNLPFVLIDPSLIERVINNLVNNAIKFTSPGGKVVVGAVVEGRCLVLSVADTGPGIDRNLRDKLFQKFSVGRIEGRGSGLGLAFCKLAVEAHGGRIWIESPSPSLPPDFAGPGSVFSFTLPLAS